MIYTTLGGGTGGMSLYIQVKADPNTQVTASKGTLSISDTTDENGEVKLYPTETGEWTVSNGEDSISVDVQYPDIEANFQTKIFGIKRDITSSSSAWERTDDAVGMEAVASVGTVAGHSDFDNFYPWREIDRETLSTGDVMVKIPKFWYKRYREGNIEYIKIANEEISGFEVHPAFKHNNLSQEYIYVGAYETSDNNKSISGATPTFNIRRTNARTYASNKGAGWGQFDLSTYSALIMLYLVEYADYNSQTIIGQGVTTKSAGIVTTGLADNVPGLTGRSSDNSNPSVVYRGVENLWGNLETWLDGILTYSTYIYYSNNQSNYNDGDSSSYDGFFSFQPASTEDGWGMSLGYDPSANWGLVYDKLGGSTTKGLCDYIERGTTGAAAFQVSVGGYYSSDTKAGLFNLNIGNSSGSTNSHTGARLVYIPTF